MASIDSTNDNGPAWTKFYRGCLMGMVGVTLGLVAWEGERMNSTLDTLSMAQSKTDTATQINTGAVDDLKTDNTRIWGKISDHEHRLTVLEANEAHAR